MEDLVIGYSGISLDIERFDLIDRVVLRSTSAHFMAPFLVAFAPAPPGMHHPGPWKSVIGGLEYDILFELFIPVSAAENLEYSPSIIAWVTTALLRLRTGSNLTAPIASNVSFDRAVGVVESGKFQAIEVETKILSLRDSKQHVTIEDLEWIRDHMGQVLRLFVSDPQFRLILEAFDETIFTRTLDLGLLQLWAALEALFSPSRTELRYRVSTNIASYLLDPGNERMDLQKRIKKLYDARSAVAHGRDAEIEESLNETYALVRQVIERIIAENKVPSQDDLNARVFGVR
jgi:hypothetical protein